MPDILYAVHTRSCTYLLDDKGVCRWIVSATGMLPPDVRRCVGAQFVACLDMRASGGLVGELRIGATALFVTTAEDNPGKLLLLRTGAIQHVEFRDPNEPLPPQPTERPSAAPPRLGASSDDLPEITADIDIEITTDLDPDDIVYQGEEATVTLTLPLFRPDTQMVPPLPPRGDWPRR